MDVVNVDVEVRFWEMTLLPTIKQIHMHTRARQNAAAIAELRNEVHSLNLIHNKLSTL